MSRRNGGFLGPAPLRRVRAEHITAWSPPLGTPHLWADLRDPFHARGFDDVIDLFAEKPSANAVGGWRHTTRRALTSTLYAEATCSTVRVLWRGFHVELLEQVCEIYCCIFSLLHAFQLPLKVAQLRPPPAPPT